MRIVHRIIQSLAFGPALAGIGIVSPAVSRAQAGWGSIITASPSPAIAGKSVLIEVHASQGCLAGRLSFGDNSPDYSFAKVAPSGLAGTRHKYAVGSYVIHSYFDPASIASVKEPEREKLNQTNTAHCKGGPVTLQVMPAVKKAVQCNDGTISNNQDPNACKNHHGVLQEVPQLCNDGTTTANTADNACANHGGFKKADGTPNTPNAPPAAPPAPSPNTTGTGVTCNDGTVSNSQGKGACKDHHGIMKPIPQPCNDGTMSNNTADLACAHHGGFKNANGTPNAPPAPPAPPPSPNTNTTGATCNDGTTSSSTGKGACAHHGGIKKTDSTPNAPPAPPSP